MDPNNEVKTRVFIVIESESGNSGWVVQAPSQTIDYFIKEILKSVTIQAKIKDPVSYDWIEYLKLEKPGMTPCQEYKIGSKSYYVELLTSTDTKVALIPVYFN